MSFEGEQFSAVARRYCDVIDGRAACSVDVFLDLTVACLLDLARGAHRLPTIDGDGLDESGTRMAVDESLTLMRSLDEYLGDRSRYWHVHDPTSATDQEPCSTSLAGDLAEIYCDVRQGLALWESARPAQAAWEWRFGYWSHWGAHLVAALVAMHSWRRWERADE